jgi:hypothetical protein
MYEQINQVTEWETVEINYIKYEVASIPFTQFYEDRKNRQVIMREKSSTEQADLYDYYQNSTFPDFYLNDQPDVQTDRQSLIVLIGRQIPMLMPKYPLQRYVSITYTKL